MSSPHVSLSASSADLFLSSPGTFFLSFVDDTRGAWAGEVEPALLSASPLPLTAWSPPPGAGPEGGGAAPVFVLPPLGLAFLPEGHPAWDGAWASPAEAFRRPAARVLALRLPTHEAFAAAKPRVRAWVSARVAAREEYLVLSCPPARPPRPPLSAVARALAAGLARASGVHVAAATSLEEAAHARVLDRLRAECVPPAHAHRVLRLDVAERAARARARLLGEAPPPAPGLAPPPPPPPFPGSPPALSNGGLPPTGTALPEVALLAEWLAAATAADATDNALDAAGLPPADAARLHPAAVAELARAAGDAAEPPPGAPPARTRCALCPRKVFKTPHYAVKHLLNKHGDAAAAVLANSAAAVRAAVELRVAEAASMRRAFFADARRLGAWHEPAELRRAALDTAAAAAALLAGGGAASVNARDGAGRTPLGVARALGRANLVALLEFEGGVV